MRLGFRWYGLILAFVALSAAGCGSADPPQFTLNLQGRDPDMFRVTGDEEDESEREDKETRRKALDDVATALVAMFGTPDEPYVMPESGLDIKKLRLAAGPVTGHTGAPSRGLYRQHCVHCHGISGDGAGPTAAFLTPYPRDYRPGIFKYKSTERGAKPTFDDIRHTLINGVPDTAMPSFALLHDDELDALTEYVRYLSIRGEVEQLMISFVFDSEEELEMDRDFLVENFLSYVAETWQTAEESIIVPPESPPPAEELVASIERGHQLFLSDKAQCVKCHGPTGLGDGSEEQLFDDWNKNITPDTAHLYLLPQQQLRPRNLRLGVYRGGRRPIDIYRRIHAGINGTPMPGAGAAPGAQGPLQPTEIWDLVNYVLALPYEEASFGESHASTAEVDYPQMSQR